MKMLLVFCFLAAQLALAQDDFELLLAPQPIGGSTPPPPADLTQMMSAYWWMDSTNGAGSDSWGTNNLTPFGGITNRPGLLTNCVVAIAALTQKEVAQQGPDLVTVNRSWAFSGWFKWYNNTAGYIAGKYVTKREWSLFRTTTLLLHYSTNALNYATLDSGVLPSSNVWHLITAMVESTNRQMIMVIDLRTGQHPVGPHRAIVYLAEHVVAVAGHAPDFQNLIPFGR